MTQDNLEAKVKSNSKFGDLAKKRSNFIKADIIGEVGAAAGSYIGAKLGQQYFKGSSKILNILSGSIPGDYLLGSLFAGGYWYSKNKEEYKGWEGKKKFAKDLANFHIRDLPATIAAYAVYAPITAAGLSFGLAAAPAAVVASVLSSVLFIGGSYLLNKNYLQKLGEKKADSNLSPASPQAPTTAAKRNAA